MWSRSGRRPARCRAAALAGETGLATDLKKVSTTPAFSFITPNLCDDGHDYPCTNQPSGASALADIDTFLQTWVPLITNSPAFKKNGLLEITFDESDGPQSDASSCCGEQPGPGDSPLPGITGPGGGLVGAVLLSPFIAPGTVSDDAVQPLLVAGELGDAAGAAAPGRCRHVPATFGSDMFTATHR